jgi:hypothetical protein
MTLSELIAELRSINPDKPENVAAFERLLADVVSLKTSDSIGPLLRLFRDNVQYDELMFSIIHSIEIFDDQTYVSQVLSAAPALCSDSPRWASILFMRILNSEATRLELVRQLRNSGPKVKAAIKDLMEKISARNVKFLPKIAAVLVAAS